MRGAAAGAIAVVLGVALTASPAPHARADTRPAAPAGVVPAGALRALAAGASVRTTDAAVDVRTAAGGSLRVMPRSVLRHDGTADGVESFFLVAGTVEGDVGPRTMIGTEGCWATAAAGGAARVRATAGASGAPSSVRAVSGGAWLRFHAVAAWLPAPCEATLGPAPGAPGAFDVAAGAVNPVVLDVQRSPRSAMTHAALVPPGARVRITDRGAETRVECVATPPGRLVRVESRREGSATRWASVGPGAVAVAGPGAVRIEVSGLPASALRSLLGQDREFASVEPR